LEQLAYLQAEREFKKRHRHHTSIAASMSAHTHPLELVRQEKHHELDGFVHTDAHDAFDPDEIEGEVFDSESDSSNSDDESVYSPHSSSRSNSRMHTPRPSLEKEEFMAWRAGIDHDERHSVQQGLTIELRNMEKRTLSEENAEAFADKIVESLLSSPEAKL